MGPLTDDILSAPYPIIQILLDRTESKALVSVVAILIILQTFPCACGALATSSRLTLQLAQQGALPQWWTSIWSLTGAIGPLVFVCCFSILMLLTNIGSDIAIVVMFNLATGFLVLSYGVLILVRIAGRASRGSDIAVGKWHLGKWGLQINCVAASCCIFIVTCQVLPLFEPVEASTFPYLGPSIAFVILLGGIDHCVRRHAFNPIRNIRVAKDIVEDEPAIQHSHHAVV
ncbi:MAG: hypothetical protein M1821_009426 [Bathelium mastoideum]|nr:MAG: hypothetical protein M1821_009426 [Bathelium mastoideum]